jgi:hypothetical protein
MLARADILSESVAGNENSALRPVYAAQDYRSELAEPGVAAFNAERPAGAEMDAVVHERRGFEIPDPQDWQGVPA